MHNLIAITPRSFDGQTVQTVNARELWQYVESSQQFADWIKNRIEKYKFSENLDFIFHKFMKVQLEGDREVQRPITDYHLTLDMAKELAMVENNPKGREVRRYFIDCERQAKAAHEQHRMTGNAPNAGRGRIPSHEADRIVAASRTFNALLRSAQAAKVPLPTALRRAAEVAQRETGIDLIAELRAEDHVAGLEARHHDKEVADFNDSHQGQTRSSAVQFWQLWSGGGLDLPYQSCLSSQAYQGYMTWCQQTGQQTPHRHEIFTKKVVRFSQLQGKAICVRPMRWMPEQTQRMLLVTEPPLENQGQWAEGLATQFAEHLKAFARKPVVK